MKNIIKAILAVACLSLIACSRVNEENYNKIQTDMTLQQVEQILGKPDSMGSINIGELSGTSANWHSKYGAISIQFLNNKVQIKNYEASDQPQNNN